MPLALLGLVAAAIAATPVDPAPLAPRGIWALRDEPGACAVQRAYGPGAPTLILALRPDGEHVEITLAGASDPTNLADTKDPAHLTLLPAGRQLDGVARSTVTRDGVRMTVIAVHPDPLDGFGTADIIVVDTGRGPPASFAIDQQVAARALLHSCHDALVRSWGVDPALFLPLEVSPSRFFGAEKYPDAALRAEQQGRVTVLVAIPPSGHVIDCRVVESSHSESLDAATCDIIVNKATFAPARDGAGKPMTIWTVLSMRWVLPD